ncbi:tyrosine--tRNA ligase [Patescibacteria group bacterium]
MKVDTNEQKIDEILSRGVVEVIEKDNLKKKLLSGKQLRIKLGIDPTSPNIHLGRATQLLKLKDLQDLGHKIVFIVGDFTGVIGDTSDKEVERPMLSQAEIKKNLKSYFKQMGIVLDTRKVEKKYNSKWLKKLGYTEIGEQADKFSVADFIARENIKKRLDAGKRVSLREVLYPLMQGYDSVAVKADVEFGGTDQRFNLLAGRKLQESFGQKAQDIIMTDIINGTDGRKMSSSWGNVINIIDTPADMYGKIMSMKDENIIPYFVSVTRVPMSEVNEVEKKINSNEMNPRDAKMKLAHEIVSMFHNEKDAKKAEEVFVKTFQERGVPEDIEEVGAKKGDSLGDILLQAGTVESKNDFKRLITSGAVKNIDTNRKIEDDKFEIKETVTLKIGKKRFVKITI